MDVDERVCPFCGQPPGPGMFCASCGRNLAAVERLPTRAEWAGGDKARSADQRPLDERCAEATSAFLAAMHAAGDPGAIKLPVSGSSGLWRPRRQEAWVLRPVQRAEEDPLHHEPGLVLTTEGRFHRLESEVRGWGQRDFPRYYDNVEPDPIDMPVEERLVADLAAVLRANEVAGEPPRS
jgi:hypothetical protein